MYVDVGACKFSELSKKKIKIIQRACEYAEKSNLKSFHVGACLIYRNESVFYGNNNARTRFGKMSHFSLHAEVDSIFKMLKTRISRTVSLNMGIHGLKPSTIYVVRIMNSSDLLGNSKPCEYCQPILERYNITRVYYTNIINGEQYLCEMRLV